MTVKFHFKRTILNFKIKFAQKEHFRLKTEKVNTTIEFCILEIMWVQNFTLNKRLWNLGANLPRKSIFGRKRKKWTSPLNSTYSNFTISSKRIFQVKNRKSEHHHWILHIWISLGIKLQFKLTFFLVFGSICLKKVFPAENRKREHRHWILHIQISLGTKFQHKLTILIFFTRFDQKGYFWSKNSKSKHHHYILHFEISHDTKLG